MSGRLGVRSALLATVVLMSACGGELSRGEFVSQANEICGAAEDSIEKLGGEETEQPDPSEFADTASEELGRLLDRLRELEAPGEIEDTYVTMLDNLEEAIDDIGPLSDAVEQSVDEFDPEDETANAANLDAVREINERLSGNLSEASEAATAIDLDRCASTADASGTS